MAADPQWQNKMEVAHLDIDDLEVGMSVHYTTRFGREEVRAFAALSGDVSPLHVDEAYGKVTEFGGNLVHGLLLSAHFSTLVGVFLPGRNALLTEIQMDFVKTVPVGSEVVLSASVTAVRKAQRIVDLRLLAYLDGGVCARGRTRVKVRPPVSPENNGSEA